MNPDLGITQYSRTSWTVEDGLPQDTIRDLAQTPDGFLWFGTQAGLVRFDGLQFRVYDRRNSAALDNQHIYALTVDTTGALWVGTNGGGLLKRTRDGFEPLPTPDIPTGRITALEAAADGTLWIGTYGDGLLHYDPRRPEGQRFDVFKSSRGLAHEVIFDLALDDAGGLWIATYGGGAQRLHQGRFATFNQANSGLNDRTWAVEPTADGDVWIGTNDGLFRWRGAIVERLTPDDGLSHRRVISLRQDLDGNLWIGTYGGGLNRRRSDGSIDRLEQSQGLAGNIVWSLFEDQDGSMWIGTLGTGLTRLRQGAFITFSVDEGLSSNVTSHLYMDRRENLWVATRGSGVNIARGNHPSTQRFEHFGREQGLQADGIWALLEDRRGNYWFATNGHGVQRLAPSGDWTYYTSRDGLAGDVVFNLLEHSSGDLYFATNSGLSRWRQGSWHVYGLADGLANLQIRGLHEDTSGDLWVGTTAGLCRLHLDTDREGARPPGDTDPKAAGALPLTCYSAADGLPNAYIADLHQDDQGVLWLATAGGGLVRFDGTTFTSLTTRDGLLDDELGAVLEDDMGFFWLASSRGVFRMHRQVIDDALDGGTTDLSLSTFGPGEGIKNRAGQAFGMQTPDGRIWFTHLGGYSVVDPDDLHVVPAPSVLLEDVRVNGEPLSESAPPLSQWSRDFEFHFTAPTLTQAQRIQFRYRLVGFDESWKRAPRREAVYSYLQPGDYTFEVMASDSDGAWKGPVTSFSLRVAPPFYRSSAFFLAVVLTILTVGYLAHELRIRGMRQRERELNQRVDESMARLKILRGLLPVCSNCHKVREKDGAWQPIERYISEHSEASMSHSVCPDCAVTLYPGIIEHPDAR